MLTVQTKTEKITKVFEGKLKDKDAFFFFLSFRDQNLCLTQKPHILCKGDPVRHID